MRRRIVWASIAGALTTFFLMFVRFFLPRSILEPSSIFRIGSPKTDLEGETPKGAYIPLFGPSRYVADPVLTDPKAIADALAALTNEPVILVPKRGPSEVGTLVQPRSKDGRVWFHLYHETRLSYGYMGVNIDDVKSIGRAWLKTTRR